jgi:hypothetical protein
MAVCRLCHYVQVFDVDNLSLSFGLQIPCWCAWRGTLNLDPNGGTPDRSYPPGHGGGREKLVTLSASVDGPVEQHEVLVLLDTIIASVSLLFRAARHKGGTRSAS